jgi:hypothetical protein
MILNGECACTNQRWGVETNMWEIQFNLSNYTYLKWMICFDKEDDLAMLMGLWRAYEGVEDISKMRTF